MSKIAILLALGVAVGTPAMVAQAQSGGFAARVAVTVPGVLTAAEVTRALPLEVLFKGQTVMVEGGYSGGARWADGSVMMAALVDTRGSASVERSMPVISTSTVWLAPSLCSRAASSVYCCLVNSRAPDSRA